MGHVFERRWLNKRGLRKEDSGPAGLTGAKQPSFAAPSPSPTLSAVPPRSSSGPLPTWCAWVSSYLLGRSRLSSPISPSARGSSAYEPTLTRYASASCRGFHRTTCQELIEPHQHV